VYSAAAQNRFVLGRNVKVNVVIVKIISAYADGAEYTLWFMVLYSLFSDLGAALYF